MFERFGDERVYRADLSSERIVDRSAEIHLRKRFRPGVYEKQEEIDAILKHQIQFFGARLDKNLPLVASQHFMDFILDQYETATRIHRLFRENGLTQREGQRWTELEKNWRRTLKYIAERCTLLADTAPSPKEVEESIMEITDEVLICAEQLVGYCILSDQTQFICPNSSRITINRVSSKNYFDHEILNYADVRNYWSRVNRDREKRAAVISEPIPEFDLVKSSKFLDSAFVNAFGRDFKTVVAFLGEIRKRCVPPKEGFQIPFCNQDAIVKDWSADMELTEATTKKLISGFSLSKERMELEGRDYWNPKYICRAYRRAIFEFPHETGIHLTFSPAMFSESLEMLVAGFTYKQVPPEWKTSEIESATNSLSQDAGKWFERLVQGKLVDLGYRGRSFNRSIGQGTARVTIPSDVGELDFLGLNEHEESLILIECKRTQPGAEPKFWRKDVTDFVEKRDNYSDKFRKKINWVNENLGDVISALNSENQSLTMVAPKTFFYCMVTMYPNIASYQISDFPCVSVVEFCLDYLEKKMYPYSTGVAKIDNGARTRVNFN